MKDINLTFGDKLSLMSSEISYRLKNRFKFLGSTSYSSNILNEKDAARRIVDNLNSSEPFLVGRFGMGECRAATRYFHKKVFGGNYGSILYQMCNGAGFFPAKEDMLDRYAETVLPLYQELDLLCLMNAEGEDFIIKHTCPNAQLTNLRAIEPAVTQWTAALEGKKVLVIHPFDESIKNQYTNHREKIYAGTNILPKFDLQTIKAVQTAAGNPDSRFSDWFEALDYMTEQALNKDFDVALLGCGAYGLPLGARIKQAGKQAIHMGGCLQLLFGIRGARWDTREYMQPFYNESWTRPLESETPEHARKVENACYW